MKFRLGPILSLRPTTNFWSVSVLVVVETDDPPVLEASIGPTKLKTNHPVRLLQHGDWFAFRYVINVSQEDFEQEVSYRLKDSDEWKFSVPAKDAAPHILFGSCNGFSDAKYMKHVKQKNFLWSDAVARHSDKPFHLMILGGDQIYGDPIWNENEIPSLNKWVEQDWDCRVKSKFTKQMKDATNEFYFRNLYCNRWCQDEPARMFSTVPSIMMWDDHDIFDGWGSYPDEMQNSPVYKGIYKIARRHFVTFQLQTRADRNEMFPAWPNNFTNFKRIGPVGILVLDLRSERDNATVMSEQTWKTVKDLLYDANTDGLKHLLIVSSIPVVHPDFSMLEKILNFIPGQQNLEDDLRDHWHSAPHKIERLNMIKLLFRYGKEKRVRVTFLSGDVHLAAVGAIINQRDGLTGDNANVINQLTSSAIVHPPPPGLIVWALNRLGDFNEEVDRDIFARMLNFRGTHYCFVGRRNWMELTYNQDENSILAEWRTERDSKNPNDGIEVFSKVVNCCSEKVPNYS